MDIEQIGKDNRFGYVINFGMSSLKDGVVRFVNKLSPLTPSRTSRTLREESNAAIYRIAKIDAALPSDVFHKVQPPR